MANFSLVIFIASSLTLSACVVLPSDTTGQCVERSAGEMRAELSIDNRIFKVASAKAGFDPFSDMPAFYISFSEEDTQQFGDFSSENIGKVINLAIDGDVIYSPTVQTPIYSGVLQVSGNLTVEEVTDYVRRLSPDC